MARFRAMHAPFTPDPRAVHAPCRCWDYRHASPIVGAACGGGNPRCTYFMETQMSSEDTLSRARRYFDAWRQRDAAAVLATLAPGGTYEDPLTGGPIAGPALASYMQALWAAFPDLDFTVGTVHAVGEHGVHASWRMQGRNSGSFNGLPPTGREVDLPGIDVLEGSPDGLVSVRGYFDSAVVPRQLGLDVLVQPRELGPFQFGASTLVRRPQPAVPGVLAFTELVASGDAHVQTIREASRQIVVEQLGNEDFLGFTASVAGRRMTTVSAWRSQVAMSAALRGGTHAQAMQRFYADGIAEGGYTAVYAPVRHGPWWRRCAACGAMSRLATPEGCCSECKAPLSALA
jgi:steroid delta-isomerase-like uncharacterized protein